MRINAYSFIIWVVIMLNANIAFSQQLNYKALEVSIEQVVKKVVGATVAVTSYDSTSQQKKGPTFTAVVVSADGYILTAAHAASPKKIYQIVFADGKKVLAIGLGSITDLDAAVIKILPAGNWPHAEMGWSSSLVPFQPCVSMGYPQNMRQSGHPLIRFGYITESMLNPGFLCNTALMEPGDSGGPLFDINGNVIGIHSRISQSLDANFEIPVDVFRKYWNDLIIPVNHNSAQSLIIQKRDSTPARYSVQPIPALAHLDDQFSGLLSTIAPNCLKISSHLNEEEASALGTLISMTNKQLKNNSYIISKSSIVGNDSIFISYEGKALSATVIARDSLKDLVLLKTTNDLKHGIRIFPVISDNSVYNDAGKFLLSPGTLYVPVKISVLSSPTISSIPYYRMGYLGVMSGMRNKALMIEQIDPNSIANFSHLKIGDRIISINGVKVRTSDDFDFEASRYPPLSIIHFKGRRHGFSYKRKIAIRADWRAQPPNEHLAERFEGGKSMRKDGFQKVFIHDARIDPSECGGPVFDTEGHFMGINIARVCRTSSIAIPAEEVRTFIQAVLEKKPG